MAVSNVGATTLIDQIIGRNDRGKIVNHALGFVPESLIMVLLHVRPDPSNVSTSKDDMGSRCAYLAPLRCGHLHSFGHDRVCQDWCWWWTIKPIADRS